MITGEAGSEKTRIGAGALGAQARVPRSQAGHSLTLGHKGVRTGVVGPGHFFPGFDRLLSPPDFWSYSSARPNDEHPSPSCSFRVVSGYSAGPACPYGFDQPRCGATFRPIVGCSMELLRALFASEGAIRCPAAFFACVLDVYSLFSPVV